MIRIPRRATFQPQSVGVRSALPCQFRLLYNGALGLNDLGPHNRGRPVSGTLPTVRSAIKGGRGHYFDGTTATTATWDMLPVISAFPFAMGFVFRVVAAPGANGWNITMGDATLTSGAGGIYCAFIVNTTLSTSTATRTTAAGAQATVTGPTLSVGSTYSVVVTSRSITDHRLFVNGIEYTSTTSTTAFDSTYGKFTLGALVRATDAPTLPGGPQHIGAAWAAMNMPLSLCREISLNPWMVFEENEILPLDQIAAAAAFTPLVGNRFALAGPRGLAA